MLLESKFSKIIGIKRLTVLIFFRLSIESGTKELHGLAKMQIDRTIRKNPNGILVLLRDINLAA
jgi:hypothetical protein